MEIKTPFDYSVFSAGTLNCDSVNAPRNRQREFQVPFQLEGVPTVTKGHYHFPDQFNVHPIRLLSHLIRPAVNDRVGLRVDGIERL